MSEPLGKYMTVNELPPRPRAVTRWWEVRGSDDSPLGTICWYPAWRCYTFWPNGQTQTVLNATCLADLERFTREQTVAQKARPAPPDDSVGRAEGSGLPAQSAGSVADDRANLTEQGGAE